MKWLGHDWFWQFGISGDHFDNVILLFCLAYSCHYWDYDILYSSLLLEDLSLRNIISPWTVRFGIDRHGFAPYFEKSSKIGEREKERAEKRERGSKRGRGEREVKRHSPVSNEIGAQGVACFIRNRGSLSLSLFSSLSFSLSPFLSDFSLSVCIGTAQHSTIPSANQYGCWICTAYFIWAYWI